MASASIKAVFPCDVQKVWDIVTSLENYTWRSDLSKVVVLNNDKFMEYTNDGYVTTFTITASEPCRRWEFDIENDNMSGHWAGLFSQKDGQTVIDFTETVIAKKLIMKPFIPAFLKKQQALYIADLRKALSSESPVSTA